MIKGLAHVCFGVKDLEASIRFYCDQLGLRPAFPFLREDGTRFGQYIQVGGRSFIELFIGEIGEPAEKQSYKHICLEVDDIQATVSDLRAKGVEVSDPKLGSDHSWQAWVADPDGNRIELHAYTEASWQAPWLG